MRLLYDLSTEEKNWLSDYGPIRVGYQDGYQPFCTEDKKTGELTGALKDFLEDASSCLRIINFDFEATACPFAAAAMEALNNGEVDCMFPSNLSTSDGEKMSLVMTPTIISTEIYALVHKDKDIDENPGMKNVLMALTGVGV